MYKCPNCGELLEDDAKICYFCKHHFSQKEIEERNSLAESNKPVLEAVTAFRRNTKIGILVIIGFMALFLLGLIMIISFSWPAVADIILAAVWLISFCIALVLSGFGRCTWCGMYIGGKYMYSSEFCRHCGKRINIFDDNF